MRRATVAAAVLAVLATPASAPAAQRLVTIDTPSRNVDPTRVRFNGADHPRRLRANVLLPDGYDGRRRFPVLFLLHGVGDNFESWARPATGDIARTAKGLRAIVVMPEAGRGFFANWWNGGRRADPGWERFYIDELVPLVEGRFRVLRGRANHAIAGASMGGFGATWLGTQLPGYFGSVASFSGFVQHQRPEVEAGLRLFGEVEYTDIFGPMDGFYATGHNPTPLAESLRHTRVYVTVGDGSPEPGVESSPAAIAAGGAEEAALRAEAEEFVAAARSAGADTTYVPLRGVHDWPYWRRHLREAIAWGLFKPVTEMPKSWSYVTVAQTGEMWGLRYRFRAPPTGLVRFERAGSRLRGRGAGTVSVEYAAALRADHEAPVRPCAPTTDLRADRGEDEAPPCATGTHHARAFPRDPHRRPAPLPAGPGAHPDRGAHRANGQRWTRQGALPAAGPARAAPRPRGLHRAAHRAAGDTGPAAALGQ